MGGREGGREEWNRGKEEREEVTVYASKEETKQKEEKPSPGGVQVVFACMQTPWLHPPDRHVEVTGHQVR